MSRLKINLEAIERDTNGTAEGFCTDGVRVGSLLVSAEGVRDGQGNAYVLSLSDLEVVPEAEGGFLGKGSSGSVRRAVHRRSQTTLALKEIKVTGQAHINEIRRELETLHAGDFATPYLVSFYGAFAHEGSVFIAMEAMDGSLHEVYKPVPPAVLASITRLMLKGLMYLHRTRHLIHRDLKPSNVLFKARTGDIKISDFGVSSNLECTKGDAHSFVGTVTYMSPERLRGDYYSYGADIWSLGLVVTELAVGVCPYAGLRGGSTEARFWALLQHLNADSAALELPAAMDAELADFINACVAKAVDKRPTCAELLQHPFLLKHVPPVATEGEAQLPPLPASSEWGSVGTPSRAAPETIFSPFMSATPTATAAADSGANFLSTPTSLAAGGPSSPVRRHAGETDEDVADRAVIARWIAGAREREARRRAKARDAAGRKTRTVSAVITAAEVEEGHGDAGAAATASGAFATVSDRVETHDAESREPALCDSNSTSMSHDDASGENPLACDDAMLVATAEPSVNLDEELNKLLL